MSTLVETHDAHKKNVNMKKAVHALVHAGRVHGAKMLAILSTITVVTALLTGSPVGRRPDPRAGRVSMAKRPMVPIKLPGMEMTQWIDVYNRLYRERIMFLQDPISDDIANKMVAVLLYLESEDANSPVAMYCNCGGGLAKSGLALYDTMRIMPYDIQTVNIGMCAQISAFIVAGGTPGKRYALPNARFVLQEPYLYPQYDREGNPRTRIMQATEMKLEVEEVLRDRKRMIDGFSTFTKRPVDVLKKDFERNFYLDALEAKQYGLIDQILAPKRPDKQSSADAKMGNFGGDGQRYGDRSFAPEASPPQTPGGLGAMPA